MRLSLLCILAAASKALGASWSYEDGTIAVQDIKGAELGPKRPFTPIKPISDTITLSSTGSVRLALTITNGGKPRRPHQAFVTIADPITQLQEAFPLNVNENGKAKLDLTQAKIPTALLTAKSLSASIILGGFGSSKPLKAELFRLATPFDKSPAKSEPLRYGKLPEIHHIFRQDPKSPSKIITLVFTLAVVATLPILFIVWAILGANTDQLPKALGAAPISYTLFFGGIVATEGLFYLYYTSWNLFQLLPAAAAVGMISFLGASGALTEVQERRLKSER